jgi:hypothetical protein
MVRQVQDTALPLLSSVLKARNKRNKHRSKHNEMLGCTARKALSMGLKEPVKRCKLNVLRKVRLTCTVRWVLAMVRRLLQWLLKHNSTALLLPKWGKQVWDMELKVRASGSVV